MLETIELQPGERLLLSLQLADEPVIVFDPVTHTASHVEVTGEATVERQELAVVFDAGGSASVAQSRLRPGALRVSLDQPHRHARAARHLSSRRAAGAADRRPTAVPHRQAPAVEPTFRDIYRTDTLDVDQRLKILSLTFLFTDLKGSTELYERVGDLVAYDLVRNHFRLLQEIVAKDRAPSSRRSGTPSWRPSRRRTGRSRPRSACARPCGR